MEFSELDSDSDERPTRSRRLNDKTRRYLRAECFRVEKNLLIFGWVSVLPVLCFLPVFIGPCSLSTVSLSSPVALWADGGSVLSAHDPFPSPGTVHSAAIL